MKIKLTYTFGTTENNVVVAFEPAYQERKVGFEQHDDLHVLVAWYQVAPRGPSYNLVPVEGDCGLKGRNLHGEQTRR